MKQIIFLCTGNSCRSQMAEGLANHLWAGKVEAVSAGTMPASRVHPGAVRAMREAGIDISRQEPKDSRLFLGREFDWIITLCDNARQVCPAFPGKGHRVHWSIPDPAEVAGDEEEVNAVFRATRDLIRKNLEELLDAG